MKKIKCAHCKAEGADNTWDWYACAEGGKKRSSILCDTCDTIANEWMLSFFRVRKAKQKMKEYGSE